MADQFGLVDDIEPVQIPKERDVFGLVNDVPAETPTRTWSDIQSIVTPHTTPQEQTKVRNAMAISATHDLDFDVAYDTEPEFTKKVNKPNLFDYAGKSFVAGVGDMYVNLSNVFKWAQIPTGRIGQDWEYYGKKMQNMYIPPDDKPFSYDKLLSPEFYATSVIRSVPSTLSLIPAALIGAELGIGAGTVMTGRALGAFTKTILGSIGAATLSRPLESAMEASGTYQQAIDSGMPEDEARRVANETFKGNMSLAGLDAAEFATAFMPMKFNTNILALRILSTLGKVGGVAAMEGAEERYQQIVQEMAVNPEAKISDFFTNNPNLNEATAIGAIFGVGLGGAGSVYTAFTDRIVKGFTPETKTLFDSLVEDKKAEGLTSEEATKKVLDEIASTPEGEKEIKDSVEKFKEQAQNITSKAEVDLITEGVKPPLEITPKAEDVTETDITEFVESEIVAPEEQLQKAPIEITQDDIERETTGLDRSEKINAIRLIKTKDTKSYADIKNISPTEQVTIYRAIPKDIKEEILPGDFVATDKEVAKFYANDLLKRKKATEVTIISKKVSAVEIKLHPAHQAIGVTNEFIYNPEKPPTIPPTIPPSEGEGGKKFEGFKVITPETEGVKTIKQRIRQTTGQVTLANMIREDKALEAAFKKAQQAAREAFRAGNKEGVEAEKVKMKNLFSRAKKIKAVQEFFNLTYADMKTVSRKNPFLMSQYEFKLYLDDVRQKAFEKRTVKNAKIALKELIRTRNLQKVENLQRALKYPSIDKMSLDQLNNFFDILDQYKKDDVFLSERRLEVVDRTDLKGIKTWREAKEAFAKEAGISVEELGDITVGQFDKYRYDTALMQRNPFYKMLVTEMHREMMNAEMRHHDIKLEAFRLAKAAEASRPQTLIHKFIPQNKLIMGYIEAPADQKSIFLHNMTPEEIDYAHFIEEYFEGALEYLVETQSLTKGRENYFVHMRQGFLENVKEEGLLQAVKNIFKHYKEDEVVFNILDEDTGNILPLEKFFQFSLHRTGGLLPTSNVTEAFLAYSKMFERKASFDKIIPKLDIYAQALTPQKLTPHGLEMDRSLKKFVNQYINNKKGRHIDQFVGKQGGAVDMGLRAIRSLTSLLDLGLNIPVSITAFVGEQVTNFVQLGLNNMTKGAQRALTPHGKAIIQKYEAWLGRSPWEQFTSPGKGITEKIHEILFVGFHESTRIANTNFLLGMITEQEFNNETITDKRLAELQLEMGRMRVVPASKSLVGSTSLGSVLTQYKTWAIPIMSTIKGDISTFITDLSKKPFNEALTTKEARELYRIVGLSSAIIITGAVLAGDDDENDTSFLGSFKRKFYRESLSLIGALDPTLYTPIRALSFMTDLAKNLKALVLLEEYKTKPELKGIEGLKKQLTPKAIKQFIPEEKKFKR